MVKNRWELDIFDAGHAQYDITKHFAAFCCLYVNLYLKRVKTSIFLQKWLDHPLLMTSYLVTISTDSNQTGVKICLRDMRTATENVTSR